METAGGGPHANGELSGAPLPPSDLGEPDGNQRRREAIDALVARSLDPAAGLCLRVLDPDGFDPVGREQATELARDALRGAARRRLAADDAAVAEVFRRVSVAGIDALAGNPGSAPVPPQVDLQALVGPEVDAAEVAPAGRLRFAVLVDAVAAARATDRQVAFVVLAAGTDPADAAVLLGVDLPGVHAALGRIGRRLADGHRAPAAQREVA